MEGLRRDSHILDASWITDKKLLHFKLSKLGQTLQVDKTCFPTPSHVCFARIVCIHLATI